MKGIVTKNKKNIIIGSIILVVLTILIIFVFRIKNVNIETIILDKSTANKISDAFDNNEISADEYVLYTAYSIFEPDKLDEKYKSQSVNHTPSIMDMLNTYENEVSENTKTYIYKKIKREDIKLGKSTNKTSYMNSVVPVSNNLVADEKYYETTLDKYIISENKNFVIWYTTRDDNNKITDLQAEEIAKKLEEYVIKYKEMYGVDFKWEKSYFEGMDNNKYKEYLNEIAPNDAEDIFNAMPVFISTLTQKDTSKLTVLAYYTTMEPNEIYNITDNSYVDETLGIPVGPYMNIESKRLSDDMDEVYSTVAHELFHHYQNYICGNGSYKICEKNKEGEELFEIETTAEWASAKVSNSSKLENVGMYLNNSDKKVDKIWPYSTFSFLMNYETTVDNGKTKILNALREHNGDTLKYLNDQTDKMDLVMRNLAKNNLINDYEYDAFKGYNESNYFFTTASNVNDIINKEQTLDEMAIKYTHITKPNDKYKISNLSNNDKTYLTIMATSMDNINEKTLKVNGEDQKIQSLNNLKVIYSEKLNDNTVVDLSAYKNHFVIFAFSNGSIDQKISYKFEKTDENATVKLGEISENNTNNNDASKIDSTNKVFDIYVDDTQMDIANFEITGRAFVDINKFCQITQICEAKYTDETLEKIKVTSIFNFKNQTFVYTLINEKQTKNFDSTLSAGKINYDLSQLDVDATSCPTGKDSNGNAVPECDETSYYVPIRFIAQALGFNVEWNKDNPTRIDITSNLQSKISEKLNIRFVLSKDKIDIDNIVTNLIEIEDSINLELNQKYYLYTVNKDNIRKYNSAISILSGSDSDIKIVNEKETDKMTYSSIELTNKSTASLGLVSTVTIDSEDDNDKAGIYPFIKVVEVK